MLASLPPQGTAGNGKRRAASAAGGAKRAAPQPQQKQQPAARDAPEDPGPGLPQKAQKSAGQEAAQVGAAGQPVPPSTQGLPMIIDPPLLDNVAQVDMDIAASQIATQGVAENAGGWGKKPAE